MAHFVGLSGGELQNTMRIVTKTLQRGGLRKISVTCYVDDPLKGTYPSTNAAQVTGQIGDSTYPISHA